MERDTSHFGMEADLILLGDTRKLRHLAFSFLLKTVTYFAHHT